MSKSDAHEITTVSLEEILSAQKIIENQIIHTPLINSPYLESLPKMKLAFKAEVFQKMGSFKLRGVLNKMYHF